MREKHQREGFLARLVRRLRRPEMPDHLRAGLWGERIAERELRRKGYRILGRRIRFGPREELDLVANDGKDLVFIEVKTRASEDFGRPVDAVSPDKQRLLVRAAWGYLRRMGKRRPDYIRFDVVEVIGREEDGAPKVHHIENAFSPGPELRLPW
jgi:putative endonuclease